MKKIKALLAVAFMTMTVTGYSQTMDKEVMIKTIFNVLKNKDEEGFVKLFPDAVTMKSFVQSLIDADTTGKTGEMLKGYLGEINDSSMQTDLRKDFKKNIKKGEDKGINWSGAELVSFTADTAVTGEDELKATLLKGKIYFRAGTRDYFIRYNEIVWFENKGWYGVSIKHIDEKSKENEDNDETNAELENSGVMTNTVQMIDSTPVVKDQRAKQAPKQPVKNKPAKSKTQTPARKPE